MIRYFKASTKFEFLEANNISVLYTMDMLALLKKRAMREHRWQYKKPIMLSGCTRRSDSGLRMRMTKSLLWCVNYESNQLF